MRFVAAAALAALVVGGCVSEVEDAEHHRAEEGEAALRTTAEAAPHNPRLPPPTPLDTAAVLARVSAVRDSVIARFDSLPDLRAREVGELRQDRNAEQIAAARRLGRRVSGDAAIDRLRREGRLVELADSTRYWVLREMDHSVPYVTPDAHVMLLEIGRRFHARLDSLRLPRYRMKITSGLRTDESQRALRRTNPNASGTVSAHEFGTTVDVSHERFAVPAPPAAAGGAWEMEAAMLEEVGAERSKALQAALGRAIASMKEEGMLLVMIEDRQPVFHMTVARRFPGAR